MADDNDEVFISGLPLDVTEQEIADYFGQIGIIKQDKKRRGMPKVWLYRDKATGEFKGEATVTYEDPFAAGSAPNWFDQKEFKGHVLTVSLSDRKAAAAAAYAASRGGDRYGGGGGGGGGRYNGGGGGGGGRDYGGDRGGGGGGYGDRGGGRGQPRPGDWTCPSCGNNCFARRDTCNRCGTPKDGAGGGAPGGGGSYGGGGGGGGGGRGQRREGDWDCSCGNNNFGWRDSCNKCGASKADAVGGGGGGGGGYGGGDRSGYQGGYGGGGRGGGGGGYGGGGRRDDDRRRDRSRSPRKDRGGEYGGGGGYRDQGRGDDRRGRDYDRY